MKKTYFTPGVVEIFNKLKSAPAFKELILKLEEATKLPGDKIEFSVSKYDLSKPIIKNILGTDAFSDSLIDEFMRTFKFKVDDIDRGYKSTTTYTSSATTGSAPFKKTVSQPAKPQRIFKEEDYITPREFKFEPNNIRETFISLVTETYPMGHEDEVVKYITPGLKKDQHGNYYTIIGDSDTSFTCHLDTASRTKEKIKLVQYKKDGQDFIMSDGTTILGADDKSGVAILMYMIHHNVPGVYWFFMGEERGGVGSGKVANDIESYPFMSKIKKMVSFDRRNYYSVITSQFGTVCCSNEFGDSLCKELNKSGLKLNLDPTGVFTDSANFIDIIPECTNVSVGYFNEHTSEELQNITYLERLAKACVACDWDKLVIKRKVGFDDDIKSKYFRLIKQFNRTVFFNKDSIKGVDGKLLINLEVDSSDPDHLYEDLTSLQKLFSQHRLDPDILFEGDKIKIELT